MNAVRALVCLMVILCAIGLAVAQFTIDYDNDTFLMDGKPFRYVSGSLHYFRLPRQYWRDRLRKFKVAGLNAVSTYVEWSIHEPEPGIYEFSGDNNVTEFIKTAEEEGLYVILRVGPYICAERTMGGFPYWLLREHPDIKLRENDERFTTYLETWLDVLLPIIDPFLYGNGGPIITVQVENEYGSFRACDHNYTQWLAGVFKKHISENALLFSTDGADENLLSCGKIPGVYATVDFDPNSNVALMREIQKTAEPRGPFVNSEFYVGWLTHWGEEWATTKTDDILQTLKEILDLGGNVNFYMFYGGTNFGFSAGANSPYTSDVTSYDYDAPITEAGDLTVKYLAIRDFLLEYFHLNTTLPKESPKGNYAEVTARKVGNFLSSYFLQSIGRLYTAQFPQSFEAISQDQGYVVYRTKSLADGEKLEMDARDYATVYVRENLVGVLRRQNSEKSLNVSVDEGDNITIVVENLGRINYGGEINDVKGILSNITVDGTVLENWVEIGCNFTLLSKVIEECANDAELCNDGFGFSIYTGTFIADIMSNIEYNGQSYPADTYLNVSNLTKGVVFVNGFNLGRYWSSRGPVYSLYVPGTVLRVDPELNTIIIIDEAINSSKLTISFSNLPIYGDPKGKSDKVQVKKGRHGN